MSWILTKTGSRHGPDLNMGMIRPQLFKKVKIQSLYNSGGAPVPSIPTATEVLLCRPDAEPTAIFRGCWDLTLMKTVVGMR